MPQMIKNQKSKIKNNKITTLTNKDAQPTHVSTSLPPFYFCPLSVFFNTHFLPFSFQFLDRSAGGSSKKNDSWRRTPHTRATNFTTPRHGISKVTPASDHRTMQFLTFSFSLIFLFFYFLFFGFFLFFPFFFFFF